MVDANANQLDEDNTGADEDDQELIDTIERQESDLADEIQEQEDELLD